METGEDRIEAAVEVRRLTKIYRAAFQHEVKALDGLDMKVPRGEIFGLLGPNGAGKTTLVKVLLDICRPTAGETFLLGTDSRKTRSRRAVGYLPEDHRFPGYLTGAAAMDLYGALSGLPRRERRRRGAEALDRVGLSKWARVKTRKYSKGMKQRLGIAQALFHDPDVLLLDEPTDGVDPVGRKAIRDLLLEFHDRGKTILINSHLLLEVELICRDVAIMNHGRILKRGGVEALTRTGSRYRVRVGGDLFSAMGVVQAQAGEAEREGDAVLFPAADDAALDAVTAALGAAGHPIREISPVRMSLEELFIDVLGSPGDEDGGREEEP